MIPDERTADDNTLERLAMFPLGSVLLPGAVLPLRLFEPRYLALIDDVLDGDGRFGVTLIERGHEVGGGDVRSSLGCVAHVVRAGKLPNNTWQVLAVGTERFYVDSWLDDDPYPLAQVRMFHDDHVEAVDETADPRWIELIDAFRAIESTLALRQHHRPSPAQLADNPATMTFEIANLLPLGPYDRQQILGTTSADQRRVLLLDAIEGLTTLVQRPETN